MGRGMNKIIIVKRKTRLEELKRRYNTIEQAKFYVEHLGADFNDYIHEDKTYYEAVATVKNLAIKNARVLEIDREYLPNMIFGKEDIVIAIGQDGLVANTMKYLDGQPLVGINPDASRWDGILLPFEAGDMERMIPKIIEKNYDGKNVTMGKAESTDGQVLYAVNDFFVGVKNHTSAHYDICFDGKKEKQSSSGVIVSTGFGMTGWHQSVMAQFRGIARAFNLGEIKEPEYSWDSNELVFQVREPYPSRFTQAELVYGCMKQKDTLAFRSNMADNGVVFSDGILDDVIEFNAGMEVKISVAEKVGRLVIN